jgi:Tfp pilus assembly protein PilF
MASSDLYYRLQSERHRGSEPIRWIEGHKPHLVRTGGIISVVLLLFALVWAYHRYQTTTGLEQLRTGILALQSGKIEEALVFLEKARIHLTSGNEAQLVRFYLSEVYSRVGKPEEAKQLLSMKNSQSSGEAEYFSQRLLLAQGNIAEQKNDLAEARIVYENAAAIEGPFTADAMLALARVTEAAGDSAAASAVRDKFLTAYPNSSLAEVLRQKLGK